jgi:hypothetical protein
MSDDNLENTTDSPIDDNDIEKENISDDKESQITELERRVAGSKKRMASFGKLKLT